jgi:hypothetical protein
MSNSSSDKASESKRPQPDRLHDDRSNTAEPSDYYYDDATGYEIYEDDDDEETESEEELENRAR